jgi:hypothetical protein
MSNKKKSNRVSNNRPSLKGKWNKVGAPPKKTRWPGRPFTMDRLFELNAKGANRQCELSLRNKVSDGLINPPKGPSNPNGFLYMLADKKQKGGSVGRPKSQFVLKVKFDASRMTLRPSTEGANVTATVRPVLPPNFRPPPTVAPSPVATPTPSAAS